MKRLLTAEDASKQFALFYLIFISLNFKILENVAQSFWFQKYVFCHGFCGNPESLVEIGSLVLEELVKESDGKSSPSLLPNASPLRAYAFDN